jgi:hypothetical protein
MAGYSTTAQDAVDCIAYYGVTAGIGGGLYGPAQDVSRVQMAIFLASVLETGGETLDTTAFGFTDIGTLSTVAQDAINAIANAGVTAGVGGGLYDPAGNVPRWQMAFFLSAALGELGVTLDTTAFGFTDIGTLSTAAQDAINGIANAGVSAGIGGGLFAPMADVTRVQMALFLAATMDEAGIMPSGVTVSAESVTPNTDQSVTITVSVVADNLPVEGQRVDIFVAEEFNANGSVKTYAADDELGGGGYATGADPADGVPSDLEAGDLVTDVNGEVDIELTTNDGTAHDVTVVAWIGVVGEDYSDAAADEIAMVDVSWGAGVYGFNTTTSDDDDDLNTGGGAGTVDAYAPFGDSQGFIVQLEDVDGDDVAEIVDLRIERYVYDGFTGDSLALQVETVKTDASGAYTESHNFADPSTATPSTADYIYADIYVSYDFDGDGSYADESWTSVYLEWNDDVAEPDTTTVTGPAYADIDGFATFTAEVLDQFGDPISGIIVEFSNSGATARTATEKTTNSSGKATWTVAGFGDNSVGGDGDETIWAEADSDWATDPGDYDAGGPDGDADIIWADAAPSDLGPGSGSVTVLFEHDDTANDVFIAEYPAAADYWWFTYNSGDDFYDGAPATLANFETFLKGAGAATTFDVYYDRETTVDAATVSLFEW